MKKVLSLIIIIGIVMSLSGCSSEKKILATIITNSGETKKMTLAELKEIEDTNSILFDDEYVGADITVTSTITEIGGAYMKQGWFKCEAFIELEADNIGCFFKPVTEEYARALNVGDKITVSGKIGMASVSSFDIYILADEISPY